MPEPHCVAKLRHPTATPHPAAEKGVKNRADKQFAEQEGPEGYAFADGPHNNVSRCFHEYYFKQRVNVAADIVSRPYHEKAFATQKSPEATAQKEVIQGGSSAQVSMRRVDGHGPILECVPNRIICNKSEDVGREVQHHQVSGVLLSHQPAGEKREPGLHEEHEISSVERPSEIGSHSDVACRIGELQRKRLLGRLGLELVEILLLLRVIGSRLVGRLGNDEGVTSGVNHCRLVTCIEASRIRLRLLTHPRH